MRSVRVTPSHEHSEKRQSLNDFETLRRELAAGDASCVEITRRMLREIERRHDLNAFLAVAGEESLRRAEFVDARIAAGAAGPLAGMVVAVKDSICTKRLPTTCGSSMLAGFLPPYDATVIERLEQADAIVIGKTNMDEFSMGSSTETSAFGVTRNPSDASRVPGGSSGGSAAAVAAGLATTALGSDTGGSIRQPAAFCGVVGLKPTYGRVSRYGLVAFASSFDQIGPLGSTVSDVARVLGVIAGHDPRDSTSSRVPVPDFTASLTGDIRGLRVGVPVEYAAHDGDLVAALDRKVGELRERGAVVREVSLPHSASTIAAYYVLTTAEASSNLARFDGARYGRRAEGVRDLGELYVRSRTEGFGDEVKRRIMLGTYVLSAGYYDAYYLKGQKVRRLIQDDFTQVFQEVDCLLTPTTPTTAFAFGEKSTPLEMYLSDVYTVSANLAGIPGVSVPCGVDRASLPIGLQLLGRPFDEETILRVADVLQETAL